jgi:hypothetical protein
VNIRIPETAKPAASPQRPGFNPINSTLESTAREEYRTTPAVAN